MKKIDNSKMFDRIKPSDEASASASSAKGIGRHGVEGSLRQDSSSNLHTRGQEHPQPGVSTGQNKQGYCNCCHVHYSNLEQHVFSSQHRHFTTYSRNRTGTSSLMERFLQDVLQHHPHRYHDNRPTYDDMPLLVTPEVATIAHLSPEKMEKRRNRDRQICSKDQESVGEICSSAPFLSREGTKKTSVTQPFIKKQERRQEHVARISQQPVGICSNEKCDTLKDAQIVNPSHEGKFTALSHVSYHFPVSNLIQNPSVNPKKGKNYSNLTTSNLIPHSGCDKTGMEICNSDTLLNPSLNPAMTLVPSVSHQNSVCSHRNPLYITSGQSLSKRDGLRTQDETLVSDFHLRDTVGVSSSLGLGTSPQLARCKNVMMSRGGESSVDETIENVILKYCHGTTPQELYLKEENNSCLTFSSLLDHTHLEDSEMSFDCDAPIQTETDLAKAAIKDLEFLKEVQVSLQDKDYGTQLSSVLQSESVEKTEVVKQDVVVHPEEPVLPALPHVPPSFVGKTWSQIMHEDDIKIEELVRDFREGRFHCYFDSESSANCTRKRRKEKKQKDEKKNNIDKGDRAESAPVKALPEFNDALSGGSDFNNPSLASSDTICNPQILKTPRKRTWRLASRCQVVKVSHGTQTSLLNYPVSKRKVSRKECDPPDQKASIVWLENEKTPNMKTRLCALKLPESYSKIMSPVQPKTVVYVLSCPEIKQCKGKPVDVPQMRKTRNSTDSKDSVRYKYKQCPFKYYDPLTNRILKTPPKSVVGEKARKPSHVRQLFRSLSSDVNKRKLTDAQRESMPSMSLSCSDLYSSPSASFLIDPGKGNDAASSQKADGSSVSTERTDCLVSGHSENSFKHLIISPLNSHQSVVEGDGRLTPFNRVTKSPLTSVRSERLERENPKAIWKRKEGTNKEPFFPRKATGPVSGRCTVGRRGNRVTAGKQTSRTKKRQKDGMRKQLHPCAQKSAFSIHRYQTRKTTVGKHLKKEKSDAKKLKVRRKPKRTFMNSPVVTGIPEKREKVASESFPRRPERTSSKVRKWEVSGDRGHPSTVNQCSRRTSAVPLL